MHNRIFEVGDNKFLGFLVLRMFFVRDVCNFGLIVISIVVSDGPNFWCKMWIFDEAFFCEVIEFVAMIELP